MRQRGAMGGFMLDAARAPAFLRRPITRAGAQVALRRRRVLHVPR